jgi:2-oxoisovalerate dehydrogenase E1 component
VPEIQFRKYAEPALEQINDCGTMRWRTNNRFAAPMVLRMPVGFLKCGDPWHSQTNEVQFVHNPGWLVAVPSNAEDAVGLLRAALRGNDPAVFLEHRAMLDDSWARRPGRATPTSCRSAAPARPARATGSASSPGARWCRAARRRWATRRRRHRPAHIVPWEREMVLESVRRTRRCLIVHEDLRSGGFGAEIAQWWRTRPSSTSTRRWRG